MEVIIVIGSMIVGCVISLSSVILGARLSANMVPGKTDLPSGESEETGAFTISTDEDAPLFPEANETNPDEAHVLEKTQKFLQAFGGK
jgi:hypothetical protein